MAYEYKKGADPQVDLDFETAVPIARMKVGDTHLFWKGVLKWYGMPLAEATKIYRRMEEVRGKTGCCSNDFSIHTLIVTRCDGEVLELKIGEALYRHEPELLMEELRKRHPEISYTVE